MTTNESDDINAILRECRSAKTNLKKGRDFWDWHRWARGYDLIVRRAQEKAGSLQGTAYNMAIEQLNLKWKVWDKTGPAKHQQFPNPETRNLALKMFRNFDYAQEFPGRQPIKEWYDNFKATDPDACARCNHPKTIVNRWLADTATEAEKEAKKAKREQKAAVKAHAQAAFEVAAVTKAANPLVAIRRSLDAIEWDRIAEMSETSTGVVNRQIEIIHAAVREIANVFAKTAKVEAEGTIEVQSGERIQ